MSKFSDVCAIIFCYNRPEHTMRTIESFLANKNVSQVGLLIFQDGAKSDTDQLKVGAVRNVINKFDFSTLKSFNYVKHNKNLGLAKSILYGVDQAFEISEKVIVLEDDIVTNQNFLNFHCDALELFKDSDVGCICGYSHLNDPKYSHYRTLLPTSWGWSTWKDKWQLYETDGKKLREKIITSGRIKDFDYNGNAQFWRMLNDQINGKNDSWAVRWYASLFNHELYSIYPTESLVSNIGNDGSGTNNELGAYALRNVDGRVNYSFKHEMPYSEAYLRLCNYFTSIRPSITTRIVRKLTKLSRQEGPAK